MAEINNDNAILFSTYVSLYVNDIACNAVTDIESVMNRKDKKALKRWRELDALNKHYFSHVRKVVRLEGSYFLSYFNSIMDECADNPMSQLPKGIRYCLQRHNIQDDGLICNTIVAHVLTELAVTTVQSLCDKLKEDGIPFKGLLGWRITKIRDATRELYYRVCRDISNDILKEIAGISTPIVTLLTKNIAYYKNFERAYEYAIKKENERNG